MLTIENGKVSVEAAAFYNARRRCTNPADKNWSRYGGRGIRFLFSTVDEFYAHLGPRPTPQHSLDRINNDGNYEPGNVRWATRVEQVSTRSYGAEVRAQRGRKMPRSVVTVYIRQHFEPCKYAGRSDRSFSRDCQCIKWLRWSADRKQYRKTTESRSWVVAEEKRTELQGRLDRPDSTPQEVTHTSRSIKEAVSTFITAKRDEGCGPGTLRKLTLQLGQMVDFLAARSRFYPADITPTDLIEFRSTWTDQSGVTRQKRQQNIRGFLRSCCGENLPPLMQALKTIRLSKADVERLEPQPFSEEEILRLLRQVPLTYPGDTERIRKITALIRFQISTGLAIRDAVQLERGHIANGWLRIKRQKTGKPVEQKLNEGLCQELLSVAGPRFVFWSGTSRPESATGLYLDDLRPVMQEAGLYIKGNLSHRFRDTAVDYWIGAGCSLLEVASLLGDTVPTVERHYRRLLSARMQERLAKIPTREWSL